MPTLCLHAQCQIECTVVFTVKPLRICLLNGGFDTSLATGTQLLDRYWHVTSLAAALAELGHQVTVIQAFHCSEELSHDKVSIEFVATGDAEKKEWAEFGCLENFEDKLQAHNPDVVHIFGMTMLSLRMALGDWCAEHGIVLSTSFHGGRPSYNPIGWWRQRLALAKTSAFFFPSNTIAQQWRRARLLPDTAQVTVLPEVSSPFKGLPKEAAREKLELVGYPVFAWSGHLNPGKDPITTLQGMQRIVQSWPDARLLMAYQSEEMMPDIIEFLNQDAILKSNVTLLGALRHSDMETLFSAADFFVHSSLREWGSNSLVEAMSCGAIPVVSDIPSLRTLTEHVDPAVLFAVGDYKSLARQVLDIPLDDIGRLSRRVQSTFVDQLSYPVLASGFCKVWVS